MKGLLFIIFLFPIKIICQEIPASSEQQLEQLADITESESEDDSWLQDIEQFKKHPLNLNTADRTELLALKMLNALQVEHFLKYRAMLGMLVSIYELQAVPGWDVPTIKSLLPFVKVFMPGQAVASAKSRIRGGQHQVVWRMSRILEKASGYTDGAYPGNPWKYFFRYRYHHNKGLQWGIVGEKDAGEGFFKSTRQKGFDFYSLHLFASRLGNIRALAIGDYTINLGQGLIHWQGLAFKKSAEVMNSKRQAPVIRPYSAAGEYLFHRGAAITWGKKNIEATAFLSFRKLDGRTGTGEDGATVLTSFNTSGYHRTETEEAGRGIVKQKTVGGNIVWRGKSWHIAMNAVRYTFSLPVQKQEEPYNLFSWKGSAWWNASVDYAATVRNTHFFGEVATDKNFSIAFVNGALISISPIIDLSLVHRQISPAYQSIYGNAFTENTQPSNERGLFAGLALRPVHRIRLHIYADVFNFPWLKFRVDAPSRGAEYMVHLSYTPSKQVEWYTRYRVERKDRNASGNTDPLHAFIPVTRQSWRTQFSIKLDNAFTIRQRTELLWYDRRGDNPRQGYLLFTDIIYRPPLRPLSAVLRLASFETGDYDSRVYAYENDVMYSFSIPALSGRGHRYYITLGYDLGEHWSAWFRLAGTVFPGLDGIGSGPDEIQGPWKTEVKCQLRWQF